MRSLCRESMYLKTESRLLCFGSKYRFLVLSGTAFVLTRLGAHTLCQSLFSLFSASNAAQVGNFCADLLSFLCGVPIYGYALFFCVSDADTVFPRRKIGGLYSLMLCRFVGLLSFGVAINLSLFGIRHVYVFLCARYTALCAAIALVWLLSLCFLLCFLILWDYLCRALSVCIYLAKEESGYAAWQQSRALLRAHPSLCFSLLFRELRYGFLSLISFGIFDMLYGFGARCAYLSVIYKTLSVAADHPDRAVQPILLLQPRRSIWQRNSISQQP